jgi:hypothetical protein
MVKTKLIKYVKFLDIDLKYIWMHQMWYDHIFEGLIFDKDTLFCELSTYFAKIA